MSQNDNTTLKTVTGNHDTRSIRQCYCSDV